MPKRQNDLDSQLCAEVYGGDDSVTGMGVPEDTASLLQRRGDLHATSLQEPERKKEQVPDGAHVFCPGSEQCIAEDARQRVSSREAQRDLATASGPLLCPAAQFQSGGLTFPCMGQGPFEAEVPLVIAGGEVMTLQFLPPGVQNLGFTVFLGGADPDTRLIDNTTGQCIVGFGCSPCGSSGCTDQEYEGMLLTFNGDSFFTGLPETTNITGPSSVPLELAVRAFGSLVSTTFFYSYDGIEPCPAVPPGCSKCSSFTDCPADSLPQCNGSSAVTCVETCTLLCSALGCGTGHACAKTCHRHEEKVFAVLGTYPVADSEEDAPRPCDYCRQLCLALKYPSCYKSCLKHYSDVREISQLYAEVYGVDGNTQVQFKTDAASLMQQPVKIGSGIGVNSWEA